MKKANHIFVAVIGALALALPLSANAGYKEGIMYYNMEMYDKAFRELESFAKHGNDEAQFRVARMYDTGKGVKRDGKLAFEYMQKAADQGHVLSMTHLGIMYREGVLTKKDTKSAISWYRKATEKGEVLAAYNLAMIYVTEGMDRDYPEAVRLLSSAATAGFAAAQVSLGNMHAFGMGTKKDDEAALYWYGEAAANGNDMAKQNIKKLTGREWVDGQVHGGMRGKHSSGQRELTCTTTTTSGIGSGLPLPEMSSTVTTCN